MARWWQLVATLQRLLRVDCTSHHGEKPNLEIWLGSRCCGGRYLRGRTENDIIPFDETLRVLRLMGWTMSEQRATLDALKMKPGLDGVSNVRFKFGRDSYSSSLCHSSVAQPQSWVICNFDNPRRPFDESDAGNSTTTFAPMVSVKCLSRWLATKLLDPLLLAEVWSVWHY